MTREPVRPAPPPAPRPGTGTPAAPDAPVDFGEFVRVRGAQGTLVMQPRMGFGDPGQMRAGLLATRAAAAVTVGTLTLDSYTRLGDHAALAEVLGSGGPLNGYPLVAYGTEVTAGVLHGVHGPDFPVQVRHGSAAPQDIFTALVAARLNASEGGPVSYCLPYGRTPLAESVANWRESVGRFAALREHGVEPHLETFGGALLGQLCPPSLLVAVSVLEALFFRQSGVRSISVSYAQQTDPEQDREAVAALRRLCGELLPEPTWHVVVYAYMGLYPTTRTGAYGLLAEAVRLAVRSGAERLIVKTVAESRRIPTVQENVDALEFAARAALPHRRDPLGPADSQTYAEAAALVDAVLNLHPDVGTALLTAFTHGYLDVPYCVHPDNRGRTRSYIDGDGRLRWADPGALPLGRLVRTDRTRHVTSTSLQSDLLYMRRKFDDAPDPSALNPSSERSVEPADDAV
ncbi:methylaspartate mutase [Streptomyces hyderabadensis]|uniref:Methylaspartate mutase n=1 Tax=Streptomyces hyderabadensis TaxID=598549 RepID=A0ABP9HH29_9ACTN|nr:methylaspartate mutase [Streptomyces hyderabadensis]